jgi:hypothetical protein
VRGEKEMDIYKWEKKNDISDLCAWWFSSNPKTNIKATVIEVKSLEELTALEAKSKERLFFNRPMNQICRNFKSLQQLCDQRKSSC